MWVLVLPLAFIFLVIRPPLCIRQTDKNNGPRCDSASSAETGDRGNPCNAGTGNKYQVETDSAGGTGIPALVRYYNSQVDYRLDGAFGFGWTASVLGKRLILSGTYGAYSPEHRSWLKRSLKIVWVSGVAMPIPSSCSRKIQPDSLLFMRGDGRQERYDTTGKLVSETDASGKVTTYGYDSSGKLMSVMSPFGQEITFPIGANHGAV